MKEVFNLTYLGLFPLGKSSSGKGMGIKMKMLFEKPMMVKEAREAQKGYFWVLEFLVFIPLFIVSLIGQVLVMLPIELIMLYTNGEYMAAAQSGDLQKVGDVAASIASSDIYTVASLFSTVMMIVIVFLFCRFLQKRKLRTLGFYKKEAWKEYLKGLLLGFVAFSAAVLLGILTGGLRFEGVSSKFSLGIFLLFVVGFMIQGMAEEVICRGYFLVSVSRRYPVVVGIMLNALFFAALHLLNAGISVLALINLVLFGVFISVYFLKRGNIWGVGAFHTVWNLVQGNFYGIRVSGIETSCSVFSISAVEGKDLLSGGDFGLEGSIIVTLLFVIATIIAYFSPTKDTGAEQLAEQSQRRSEEHSVV